uniref:Cytochrome c oxidase subunit 4, mitochondrial n=1 Tax=Bionectria ochroleuca TaxID=29856 RepID=A0A0B7JVW2_BIOOC
MSMFVQRSAALVARRAVIAPRIAARTFATSIVRCEAPKDTKVANYKTLKEVKGEDDLYGPGAQPGTVPTDLEQATGLERLEILGKMEGVDVFDMTPLDASRLGTLQDPITVRSAGEEQFAGCTGFPVDSHTTLWLRLTKDRPLERCPECGSVYKMDYVGAEHDDHHHHGHQEVEEPKTFADFIKPEYRYQ